MSQKIEQRCPKREWRQGDKIAVLIAVNWASFSQNEHSSLILKKGFLGSSAGKESTCNVGDLGSIPGLERSPGEGNSFLLQYSDLENSMDCMIHGVAKSQTQLSDFHFHFTYFERWASLHSFFFLMCSLSKLFAGSLYHFYSFYLRKSWGKKRHAYLLGQKGKPGIVRPVSTFNLTPTKLLRITYSPLICK